MCSLSLIMHGARPQASQGRQASPICFLSQSLSGESALLFTCPVPGAGQIPAQEKYRICVWTLTPSSFRRASVASEGKQQTGGS